jgi:hypothetical protein
MLLLLVRLLLRVVLKLDMITTPRQLAAAVIQSEPEKLLPPLLALLETRSADSFQPCFDGRQHMAYNPGIVIAGMMPKSNLPPNSRPSACRPTSAPEPALGPHRPKQGDSEDPTILVWTALQLNTPSTATADCCLPCSTTFVAGWRPLSSIRLLAGSHSHLLVLFCRVG